MGVSSNPIPSQEKAEARWFCLFLGGRHHADPTDGIWGVGVASRLVALSWSGGGPTLQALACFIAPLLSSDSSLRPLAHGILDADR